MKLMHWAFGIALFTASCDLILDFKIGGTLRLAQIMMILVIFGAMARVYQDGRVLWPRGASALLLWLAFQLLFVPLSGVVHIGMTFFALLCFTTLGVIAITQLFGLTDDVQLLMKTYMLSYVFIAGYGLVQFIAPMFGVVAPFTIQWLIHGRLARINAFSYEPSFFATYMIMGWIMLVDLRVSKARIASGPFWKWATIAVTAALLFSTSKTAWLFMMVEGLARIAPRARAYLSHSLLHFRQGRWVLRIPSGKTLRILGVALLVALASARVVSKVINPKILLGGSGLGGAPAHSLINRQGAAIETFQAFEESPFLGRSLGGVPIYMARRHGVDVTTVAEVREHWGFPVLMEVLVASGVIGFVPFLVFLYANTFGAMRFAAKRWPEERAKWLRALARSMIFEWMMLMADQNLLRTYLWFHIAMVTLVAYHLEFAPEPQAVLHGPALPTFTMIETPIKI